jgi:protein ImuA
MKIVTCHRGQLQTTTAEAAVAAFAKKPVFATGLDAIDSLLPGGGLARGAVHELLTEEGKGLPLFVAAVLAKAAGTPSPHRPIAPSPHRPIIWSDPDAALYPPALAAAGIPLDRLFLLRPRSEADEVWALAECLRCKGVAATVASPKRLSRIEARRLQLAAEDGGGVGILLRRCGAGSSQYAAATRWLVAPVPGERTVQRWRLQLLHGHGGLIGKAVVLEVCRETNTVRASEAVGDRPRAAEVSARARRA